MCAIELSVDHLPVRVVCHGATPRGKQHLVPDLAFPGQMNPSVVWFSLWQRCTGLIDQSLDLVFPAAWPRGTPPGESLAQCS